MGRFRQWAQALILAGGALVASGHFFNAQAAEKPVVGEAPPAWVAPAEIDASAGASGNAAFRILLQDLQMHSGPEGDSTYNRSVVRVQTPQGLAGAGSLGLSWNPETDTLYIHSLKLRRGDRVIDVLASQKFAVLRRETNLEYAMLDGILTATIQPEGLQVGDIVDLAWTVTRKDPTLKGLSENAVAGLNPSPVDRLRIRATWPSSKTMQWRATDDIKDAKLTRSGSDNEILLDLKDVQPFHAPSGAPARFSIARMLEVSEFQSWEQVSSLLAPLYAQASTLAADSALKAEVAKIRAASADPKAQAAAALALVEDKIHYVFLGMDLGGLNPAKADDTWTRRFGDCKGKTALLFALLKELGIAAEPALVNTRSGDGMDARLPSVALFDHIIVRATIAGKTYWLDGTRSGDKSLDLLRVPDFGWALPVRAAGSALVRLTPEQLATPDFAMFLTLDATGGVVEKAPAHGELQLRGDAAFASHSGLANLSQADLDRAIKEFWTSSLDGLDIQSVSEAYDPATGIQTLKMDGAMAMDWDNGATVNGASVPAYEIPNAGLGWKADLDREPGPHADAPFAVAYPYYTSTSVKIRLPRDGIGYRFQGADVDTIVSGVRFIRRSRFENGYAEMTSSMQSQGPDFPASESAAAAKALKDMSKVRVFLLAPVPEKANQPNPKTAADFLQRGFRRMNIREADGAIADFSQAIKLDPKNASAYTARAVAYLSQRKIANARADLDKAVALEPDRWNTYEIRAGVAGEEGRWPDAIKDYTEVVNRNPAYANAYESRARAYMQVSRVDDAFRDTEAALKISPTSWTALNIRAAIFANRGEHDKALAEIDAAAKASPDNEEIALTRAQILRVAGRREEAARQLDDLIARHPTFTAYITRAGGRERTDFDGRRADLEAALKLEPDSPLPLSMAAAIELDAGNPAKAVAYYEAILKKSPDDTGALSGRAAAYVKAGREAEARSEFAKVRKAVAGDSGRLNNLCWTLGTIGFDLEKALGDCNASLALARSAAALDSRGLVELRLARLDQALADYDEALKLQPKQSSSLYGRGIARLRKGMMAEGQADLEAARKISRSVEESFKGYGVTP